MNFSSRLIKTEKGHAAFTLKRRDFPFGWPNKTEKIFGTTLERKTVIIPTRQVNLLQHFNVPTFSDFQLLQ